MASKSDMLKRGANMAFANLRQDSDDAAKEEILDNQEEQHTTSGKVDIVLDSGEYNYLNRKSHAAGISIQEYILNLIRKDRDNDHAM